MSAWLYHFCIFYKLQSDLTENCFLLKTTSSRFKKLKLMPSFICVFFTDKNDIEIKINTYIVSQTYWNVGVAATQTHQRTFLTWFMLQNNLLFNLPSENLTRAAVSTRDPRASAFRKNSLWCSACGIYTRVQIFMQIRFAGRAKRLVRSDHISKAHQTRPACARRTHNACYAVSIGVCICTWRDGWR